jgi:hypothetical protein
MNKKNILLIFFSLLLIAVLAFFLKNKNSQVEVVKKIAPTKTISPKEDNLSFSLPQSPLIVNQPIEIKINGNFPDKDIVGFDVLLGYDDKNFDFVKAESLLTDFRLFSFKKEGMIRITAIKSPNAIAPTAFNNTAFVSISFLPKKIGSYRLEIIDKKDIFETFFADSNKRKIYPGLTNINIVVR